MIDRGLLASMAAIAVATWLSARWWRRSGGPADAIDGLLAAGIVGLAAGRLTFLAFDDPRSITRIRDLLVIRSGVELWPGVAAALATALVLARRDGRPMLPAAAALAPLALVAYGAFELTCFLRDGCFGPRSPIGLVPAGLTTRMLPLGALVGLICVVGGLGLMAAWPRRSPAFILVSAIGLVAGLRSVASVWLPKIGDGITRPHRTSLVVLVLAAVALVALEVTDRSAERPDRRDPPSGSDQPGRPM